MMPYRKTILAVLALIFTFTSTACDNPITDTPPAKPPNNFTATPPAAPQNFIATPGNGRVALSWIPPANNGGSVIIYYEVSNNDGFTWVTANSNTGHTFTGLAYGTSYAFRVCAVNAAGPGAEAAVVAGVLRPLTYEESVKKFTFTEDIATVEFEDLNGHDLYLVKINTSGARVSAANTGSALSINPSLQDNDMLSGVHFAVDSINIFNTLPPIGHPAAERFNANPPPVSEKVQPHLRSALVSPAIGDRKQFWVELYYDSDTMVQRQATLMAASEHSLIWIMDGNTRSITAAQAKALSVKFDLIYPAVTNLLGYEYGGGPYGNGGRDGDAKIQILIYDILYASGNVAAAGYFWGKDYYPREQISYSNEAEIFYINTSTVINSPDYAYSALAHEFQHMIHFNKKFVEQGKNSATWYNEMLSMMTQDLIDELIGITPVNRFHITQQRMPTFLLNYNQVGVTEWQGDSVSYAKGYAFGAYLLRNYGGATLLQKILANNLANIESITMALDEISPGLTFEQAISRYGEAMIYSGLSMPEGVLTFDKTVAATINGFTYTANRFDIWNDFSSGLAVFGLGQMDMRPYSVTIHSVLGWKSRTGTVSIILNRPLDPNVALYVMVR